MFIGNHKVFARLSAATPMRKLFDRIWKKTAGPEYAGLTSPLGTDRKKA